MPGARLGVAVRGSVTAGVFVIATVTVSGAVNVAVAVIATVAARGSLVSSAEAGAGVAGPAIGVSGCACAGKGASVMMMAEKRVTEATGCH